MKIPWPLFLLVLNTYAFDAISRWGQAVVVVNDVLYVYGGKTDEFNSFSYTSAPNTNDVLFLSLSSPFPASSPPWIVASGSSNTSTSQGPALAWHTASAYNTSQILIFGGVPDANSDIVLVNQPDSASILDIWQRIAAVWSVQPNAWAHQPTRRTRHSTATIPSGLVFIFGGERADGSGTAFSDSYVFDPNVPSFTPLPTASGPQDLVGHVSIPLPDGRILVFGGYSPSRSILLLFSTIYVLDTTRRPYTWSLLSVSSGALPTARRAFAAALISPTQILIHGGSDAQLQTTLDDGWILDLSQPQAVWTRDESLSSLGARRDHFAVPSGDNVIFGFGYTQSSPAPAPIQIYDIPQSTIVPTFTPRSSGSTPTPTLPIVTNTHSPPSHSMTTSGIVVIPSSSDKPGPAPPGSPEAARARTTAIAVSTAFGVLAVLGLILGALWYRRRKQRKWEERRFWVIDNDEDDGRPLDEGDDQGARAHRTIPMAGQNLEDASSTRSPLRHNWFNSLGVAAILGGSKGIKSQNPREVRERRNMLDDEDAADFGAWYNNKRKEGMDGSSWSLKSILGRKNRESALSASSTPWREKSDPFSDGSSLLFQEDLDSTAAYAGVSTRPRNRREMSYASTRSKLSYTDPFSDPIQEEPREPSATAYMEDPNAIRLVPPPANIRTTLPLDFTAHTLSPLTERTSQSTLAPYESSHSSIGGGGLQAGSAPSNESVTTAFGSLGSRHASSSGSHPQSHLESPRSPTLLSSLLPAPVSDSSIKRSDSWWSRLARRASNVSTRSSGFGPGGYRDMRDPNTPPVAATTRLVTIDEKTTPEKELSMNEGDASRQSSLGSKGGGQGSMGSRQQPYAGKHGKSMSSLRTADSEAIERMERTMEVAQRLGSEGTGEFSLADDLRTDEGGLGLMVMSPVELGSEYHRVGGEDEDEQHRHQGVVDGLQAPVPLQAATAGAAGVLAASASRTTTPSPTSASPQPRPASASGSSGSGGAGGGLRGTPPTGAVAFARAQLEGRRTTVSGPRPPSSARFTVDYGLVPRRSLFIANPDARRMSGSEES